MCDAGPPGGPGDPDLPSSPENGEDHDLCVTLARREGRVILTRGRQLHRRMAGLVSRGHCYRVDSEKAADQLDEVVRHFLIDVAPDDVFKRCQVGGAGPGEQASGAATDELAVVRSRVGKMPA